MAFAVFESCAHDFELKMGWDFTVTELPVLTQIMPALKYVYMYVWLSCPNRGQV